MRLIFLLPVFTPDLAAGAGAGHSQEGHRYAKFFAAAQKCGRESARTVGGFPPCTRTCPAPAPAARSGANTEVKNQPHSPMSQVNTSRQWPCFRGMLSLLCTRCTTLFSTPRVAPPSGAVHIVNKSRCVLHNYMTDNPLVGRSLQPSRMIV